MTMMRAAQAGALVLGCALTAVPVQAETLARLGQDVVPTAQSIWLDVDARRPDYSGAVRIDLEVHKPTRSFTFHAEGLVLRTVALRDASGAVAATHRKVDDALVAVETAAALVPGRYTLDIEFHNDFNTRATSLYRLETGGDAYTFTQFEADEAREAFPCWDEPSFKIPYQVTLVVPAEHLALSNTPIESETTNGGKKTVVFKKTPPLPSYLLALATGPLDTVPIPGLSVPGRVVTVRGMSRLAAEAVRVTPPLLAALERYFGRSYPYEKLDLIAVPEFWPGAMENAGAITFADPILLQEPGRVGAAQRRQLIGITAHELAHMWFGDLVTMAWWDDLWLNEAFASWMGDKVTQEVFPETGVEVASLQDVQSAMVTDARLATRAMRRPVTTAANLLQSADDLAYNKGQAVLGMVESWLGPAAFRKGVLDYLAAHEWKNATAADLWSALSRASGKDVKGPLESFLDQPGVPLVSAESDGPGRVRLSQRRFLNYGTTVPAKALWKVPATLTWSDGGPPRTTTVLLTQESQVFTLPARKPLAWLHPNAGERGYYRWHVPSALLTGLAQHARQRLTPRERVGFVGNLRALLDAGDLRGEDYLRLLSAFGADTDPEVVTAVVGGLIRARTVFVTPELEGRFAAYVRETLGPARQRIGASPAPGEPDAVTVLRPQLLLWLGRDGRDPQVRAQGAALAASALADPTSVHPSLATVVLQLAAQDGDRGLYEKLRARFEAAKVPGERNRYLAAMASFEDAALVDDALRYSLSGPLRPQEVGNVAQGLAQSGRQGVALRWVMANYDAVAARMPPVYLPYLVYFGGGCSAERAETARAFFTDPMRIVDGTENELAKVTESVKDCVALRAREGAGVSTYLDRLLPAS